MRRFGHLTRPPRRRFAVLAAGSGLALLFGLTILTPVHLVPLFPLFWVLPFLAARAMVVAHPRSRHLPSDGRDRDDGRERQLLEAMERCGWITATRAALEASLSVAEADKRLSRLAGKGHLQVNAYEGTLAYSLWDTALPQARGAPTRRGEIEDGAS